MNTGAKVVMAASAGYLLGRTKKLKVAITVGLVLAGRKLPSSPLEMAGQGLQALQKSEQFSGLSEQVTGALADAGKRAATRSVEQALGKVSDRLREGIDSPNSDDQQEDPNRESEQDQGEDSGASDSADDDAEDQSDEPAPEESDEQESPQKKTSSRKRTSSSKKTASTKTASSRKQSRTES